MIPLSLHSPPPLSRKYLLILHISFVYEEAIRKSSLNTPSPSPTNDEKILIENKGRGSGGSERSVPGKETEERRKNLNTFLWQHCIFQETNWKCLILIFETKINIFFVCLGLKEQINPLANKGLLIWFLCTSNGVLE